MAAKRSTPPKPDIRSVEGYCTDGCIDDHGHVVSNGFYVKRGEVWIARSELERAQAYGWKLTEEQMSDGSYVVVRR